MVWRGVKWKGEMNGVEGSDTGGGGGEDNLSHELTTYTCTHSLTHKNAITTFLNKVTNHPVTSKNKQQTEMIVINQLVSSILARLGIQVVAMGEHN